MKLFKNYWTIFSLMYAISTFRSMLVHSYSLTRSISNNKSTISFLSSHFSTSRKNNRRLSKTQRRATRSDDDKNTATSGTATTKVIKETDKDPEKDRPFSLPPGEFRPKQSLGQNFLSDQNYVKKIVNSLVDNSENGSKVIEIGPGAGALTRMLYPKYPQMTAIELDQRSVAFLERKLPGIRIIHTDVLKVDWPELAEQRGGRLNIIANLPYYIVSQVLFSLADSHKSINQAIVTMQLEVAERLTAVPSTKDYGIPSVVFQLYCNNPKLVFKIPPTVFFPAPKVDSALVALDFTKPHPGLETICVRRLRKILAESFQHRRKMLRQSLKELLLQSSALVSSSSSTATTNNNKKSPSNSSSSSTPADASPLLLQQSPPLHQPGRGDPIIRELPEPWATRRPEQLTPAQFIELTRIIYGSVLPDTTTADVNADSAQVVDKKSYQSQTVWRDTRM